MHLLYSDQWKEQKYLKKLIKDFKQAVYSNILIKGQSQKSKKKRKF